MKVYTLTTEQIVPEKLNKVFPFFENPENLARLTPSDLGFLMLTPTPIVMKAGLLIDYTIRIMGTPLRWTTYISEYTPPSRFVDVQLKGPYSFWHHTHEFFDHPLGTRMVDTVKYALPMGPFGALMHALFVKRQLRKIFDYRRRTIDQIFGSPSTSQP